LPTCVAHACMATPLQHSSSAAGPATDVINNNYVIRIIAGNGNKKLANSIAEMINVTPEECVCTNFADGETQIEIKNNVRGGDVFLIQPVCPPMTNDRLVELLLMIHTLKLSSAKRITCVIPYFGYARQDRKVKPRVPISASAVAQLIEAMGPSRVLTVDLHCGQIQGFFHNTPVDNLYCEHQFFEALEALSIAKSDLVIVSPDAGGVARAQRVANEVHASGIVTILKRRVAANQIDGMQIVGDVAGKTCFVFDDMIDTGGTLCRAAELLRSCGAEKVYACATHGLFSAQALPRIEACAGLEQVWVTDSIPQDRPCSKLRVFSIVSQLARAIQLVHNEQSLHALFKGD